MAVTIRLPGLLAGAVAGKREVQVEALTVGEALEALARDFPEVRSRLFDAKGDLRHSINIFVNEEDVRFLGGPAATLTPGDEILIVPAIAGGR